MNGVMVAIAEAAPINFTQPVAYRIGKPPAGTPKPVIPPAPPKPRNNARVVQRANPADAHAQAVSGGASQEERRTCAEVARSSRAAGASTNDASHAVKHGSAGSCSQELRSRFVPPRGESNPSLLPLAIITTLLAFASSPAIAQEPLGGPIIDRIESRLESARESLDRSTAESKAWRERFDRVDRFERDGKIGSRIGTFLDRVGRIFWLVVIVFVTACIGVGLACAAYGIERVSAGAQAVLKVVQTFADTLKAWRGKA